MTLKLAFLFPITASFKWILLHYELSLAQQQLIKKEPSFLSFTQVATRCEVI